MQKICILHSSFFFFFCNFADMINNHIRQPRTIIRIGQQSLMFLMPEVHGTNADGQRTVTPLRFEPYTVKSGMSMAANLREAFRESEVLGMANNRVQVIIDAPVMLVPMEEFNEDEAPELFMHTFTVQKNEAVMCHVLPDLNSVAVFSINKDLRMVITDHYPDVRIMPLLVPVWLHLHHRSYVGHTRKVYAYFHDGQLSVFAFAKNRFRFANTYQAKEAADAAYFILYVWQQLAMDSRKDELYIVGEAPDYETLRADLKRYVLNVYGVNPSAEFNRAPITQEPRVTYDIICLCES